VPVRFHARCRSVAVAAHDLDLRDAGRKELCHREVAQLMRPQPAVSCERAEHLRDRLRRVRDERAFVVRPEDVGADRQRVTAEPAGKRLRTLSMLANNSNSLVVDPDCPDAGVDGGSAAVEGALEPLGELAETL
jgi:hypothetical protein